MLQVCENEIALRKLSGGTAQLHTLEVTLAESFDAVWLLYSPHFFVHYNSILFRVCGLWNVHFWKVAAHLYPTQPLAWFWLVHELQMKCTHSYLYKCSAKS